MATINFYLDCRAVAKGNPAPLKLVISKHGRTALISLDLKILPSQWDKRTKKIIEHPNKVKLNAYIARRKVDVENIIYSTYNDKDVSRMTAQQLKDYVLEQLNLKETDQHLFAEHFLKTANSKSDGSRRVFLYTYGRMQAFASNLQSLHFEDITKDWLNEFEAFLSRTCSKNTRNISLRNIRIAFNDAIDNGITEHYPFRKYPIKNVPTKKRALNIIELATLFNTKTQFEEYLDIFKLSFYLIGINMVDLYNLKSIDHGRIEYHRAKTKRLYSIKVEPEALAIIDKYRGQVRLLNIYDRCKNYRHYTRRVNKSLQRIGSFTKKGRGGKRYYTPLFPNLTTYWARYSWASLAAELDIPKETIAAALGHSMGNPTTAIYIDFNLGKVDEANRRVLDCLKCARFVLYITDYINNVLTHITANNTF